MFQQLAGAKCGTGTRTERLLYSTYNVIFSIKLCFGISVPTYTTGLYKYALTINSTNNYACFYKYL